VRIRRRPAATTAQRECCADEDRLGNSSADKLAFEAPQRSWSLQRTATQSKPTSPPERRAAHDELTRTTTLSTATGHARFNCDKDAKRVRALVYLGSKDKALQERPKPGIIVTTDAIVKMTLTTIWGADLHILKGDVATCEPGRILDQEGVGVVEGVGADVTMFKNLETASSSPASLRPANASIAEGSCIRIARMALGYSATRSTGPKPSSFAFPMDQPSLSQLRMH
jgi:hypothetical protein